jgi:glycosyltransferase involved in cell wall biosynthesis
MKITGFTFIKNAITYDYPIVEAIQSILPICTHVVVAVGNSTDDTLALIKSIASPKIKIIETIWDDSLKENGAVLASETNKALAAIDADTDWAFYIQGDEVVHEQYHATIVQSMQQYLLRGDVDGLLFHYHHFYGSYDYLATANGWYQKEIRIFKPSQQVYSYKDAQGFRKQNNLKLNVVQIPAYIYHYGWIKDPRAMQRKQENFNQYWHDTAWIEKNVAKVDEFVYENHITEMQHFTGTHPAVMYARIARINWQFSFDITKNKIKTKHKIKRWLGKHLGWQMEYTNYHLIKK